MKGITYEINMHQSANMVARLMYLCSQVVADPECLLGVRNETETKKLKKVSECWLCQPPTGSCSLDVR